MRPFTAPDLMRAALLCLGLAASLWRLTPGMALLLGVAFAITVGNPWSASTNRWAKRLLQIAVVGLGAGMNIITVAHVGLHGIGYTIIGIALTLALGWQLGRWLRIPREAELLLSVGTAICGGSAIAAVAAAMRASTTHISVALATVFTLNAIGLWLFPLVGDWLALDANHFGLWAALAIHDTSSVVGAALAHSEAALAIATPIKLARALWIAPLAIGIHHFWSATDARTKRPAMPWFILGFIALSALITWIPWLQPLSQPIMMIAKRLLVTTLFLIGATLSRPAIAAVGWRPFAHGVLLWAIVATTTLAAIQAAWITL